MNHFIHRATVAFLRKKYALKPGYYALNVFVRGTTKLLTRIGVVVKNQIKPPVK